MLKVNPIPLQTQKWNTFYKANMPVFETHNFLLASLAIAGPRPHPAPSPPPPQSTPPTAAGSLFPTHHPQHLLRTADLLFDKVLKLGLNWSLSLVKQNLQSKTQQWMLERKWKVKTTSPSQHPYSDDTLFLIDNQETKWQRTWSQF